MEDADYYAFCDQDDIWLPNKVERAVEKLEHSNCQVPTMYFSNYDYYDEKMNYIKHSNLSMQEPFFENALVECICLGMTMVINRKLRDTIVKSKMEKVMYHDWIVYLIATGIGEVIFDKQVTVKYRRHIKNVSNINQNFIQFQWWRIKQIVKNQYFKQVKEQLKEFEAIYANKLDTEKKEVLSLFTKPRYEIKNVWKKITYPHKFRQNTFDDIILRILFLFGII